MTVTCKVGAAPLTSGARTVVSSVTSARAIAIDATVATSAERKSGRGRCMRTLLTYCGRNTHSLLPTRITSPGARFFLGKRWPLT
jgi:hypothetical protein